MLIGVHERGGGEGGGGGERRNDEEGVGAEGGGGWERRDDEGERSRGEKQGREGVRKEYDRRG